MSGERRRTREVRPTRCFFLSAQSLLFNAVLTWLLQFVYSAASSDTLHIALLCPLRPDSAPRTRFNVEFRPRGSSTLLGCSDRIQLPSPTSRLLNWSSLQARAAATAIAIAATTSLVGEISSGGKQPVAEDPVVVPLSELTFKCPEGEEDDWGGGTLNGDKIQSAGGNGCNVTYTGTFAQGELVYTSRRTAFSDDELQQLGFVVQLAQQVQSSPAPSAASSFAFTFLSCVNADSSVCSNVETDDATWKQAYMALAGTHLIL